MDPDSIMKTNWNIRSPSQSLDVICKEGGEHKAVVDIGQDIDKSVTNTQCAFDIIVCGCLGSAA